MKIISGGQTGVDKIGLFAGKACGLETGGWAPKGYKTENGPDYILRDMFGLVEHSSSSYPPRTKKNVQESDCTLIFGNVEETGTNLTITLCKEERKRYLVNPTVSEIIALRMELHPKVINIAGNRGSKLTQGQMYEIYTTLKEGLWFTIPDKNTLF